MRLIEESGVGGRLRPAPTPLQPAPDSFSEDIESLRSRMRAATAQEVPEHEVLDALRGLENLMRAAAALPARLSTEFHAAQVADQARRGVSASRRGTAVADDLALTRKTSPYLASRELVAAKALVREMPGMLTALSDGHVDGDTARMVTEETVCLQPHDRARIDELLAPRVQGMSFRQLRAEVRALTQELDPEALVRRARKAVADRGVWVRPAPDVMALLSARLPAAAAIACYLALTEHADALKASGDERTRGQIMADELFSRLTGRSAAEGVDVEVQLVMTDTTLFGGDPAAAILNGYGPVPAQSARDLLYPDGATVEDPAPTEAEGAQDDAPTGDETGEDTDRTATTPQGSAPTHPGPTRQRLPWPLPYVPMVRGARRSPAPCCTGHPCPVQAPPTLPRPGEQSPGPHRRRGRPIGPHPRGSRPTGPSGSGSAGSTPTRPPDSHQPRRPGPALPGGHPRHHRQPRPVLPDPVVRSTHPPRRPSPSLGRRRPLGPGQRPGALRPLQPAPRFSWGRKGAVRRCTQSL